MRGSANVNCLEGQRADQPGEGHESEEGQGWLVLAGQLCSGLVSTAVYLPATY